MEDNDRIYVVHHQDHQGIIGFGGAGKVIKTPFWLHQKGLQQVKARRRLYPHRRTMITGIAWRIARI